MSMGLPFWSDTVNLSSGSVSLLMGTFSLVVKLYVVPFSDIFGKGKVNSISDLFPSNRVTELFTKLDLTTMYLIPRFMSFLLFRVVVVFFSNLVLVMPMSLDKVSEMLNIAFSLSSTHTSHP